MLGLEIDGTKQAYPFSVLKGLDGPVTDIVSGRRIEVHFDRGSEEAYATSEDGKRLTGIISYWFVWSSFNPDTDVFKPR